MKIARITMTWLCLLGLIACQSYEVSVNDNVLYTPLPLFHPSQVKDEALRTCVQQTIEDQAITHAKQLTRLSCTHAGINNLKGLEVFIALRELNLSDNALQDLAPLSKLAKLEQLLLRNNQLLSASPLLSLIKLEVLDLSGNSLLACEDIAQLRTAVNDNQGEFVSPAQCAQAE